MTLFGPAGNSISFYNEGYERTEEAPRFIKGRGLDCFEYPFGRGVRMTEGTAVAIGEAFQKEGVELSVHAPYFINFGNPDDEMAAKSYGYVLDSAKVLKHMGGTRCVFHPAAQGKEERETVVQRTIDRLKQLRDYLYLNGYEGLKFCPETMGKTAQIGTVEEIVRFCEVDQIYTPCVDFGHVNARGQGCLKTTADYKELLEFMLERLGYDRMKHFHVHFSKIMYGAKGEIKHLTFEDTVYGPEFEPLAEALWELKLEPYVISESAGTQTEDARTMKDIYESVCKRKSAQ
ncbi:MAG: TIM barrel protein [Clostridia bacterium]|nr:TIM barrel protein [Clostridia bacterium]